MTLQERILSFQNTFPQWPAATPWIVQEQGRDVLYGIWVIGNDYRNKTRYYGAFPHGLLDRIMALFPDAAPRVLHVFSGSLPKSDAYERCDLVQPAEIQASVYDLPNIILNWKPRLIVADPPYSSEDAVRYNTQMINRGKATRALASVVNPGAHLVWLDTCWPMHRKDQWLTVGRILIQRSTNHRARVLSIFERTEATCKE